MVFIFFKIGPYIWDNIGQEWEASLESKVELVELNDKCVKESSGPICMACMEWAFLEYVLY